MFASLTPDGKILDKTYLYAWKNLEDLLAWLDQRLSTGLQWDCAECSRCGQSKDRCVWWLQSGALHPYVISWYEALSLSATPPFLENDANCVGLSATSSHRTFKCSLCRVIDRDWRSHVNHNGTSSRSPRSGCGEFGYMTTLAPAEKLNNWSQLASTGNMVRYVIEKSGHTDWRSQDLPRGRSWCNALCQEAIEHEPQFDARLLLNIQYLRSRCLKYLGLSISQNPDFIQGIKNCWRLCRDAYEEYTVASYPGPCTYHTDANLYGALVNWLQEEKQWRFIGDLVPNKRKLLRF